MNQKPTYKFESGSFEEHPATIMWNRLNKSSAIPISIEKLEGLSKNKSLIYRVNGIEKNGNSIIAKCVSHEKLFKEQFIYEKILPQIPVSKLHYYGFIQEKERNLYWLFMEEIKGTPFNKKNNEHSKLASMWLAKMHSTTWRLNVSNNLPHIGTDKYLTYLNLAQKTIFKNISHNELMSDDILMLNRILDLCSCINRNWGEIEETCNTLGHCMVHGDFYSKNLRICDIDARPTFFVFDWELCKWGIMVEDLAGLDMDAYWSIVKETRFIKSREILEQLSNIGLIFRYLDWIQATSMGLNLKWIDKTIQALSYYEIDLTNICKKLEWR